VIKKRAEIKIADDEEFCGDLEWKILSEKQKDIIRYNATREIYR